MSLKTQLPIDAKNAFLNSDEFAESITYTPNGESAKSIKAIIVRNPLDAGGEDGGRVLHRQCEVYIVNDATDGVTSVNKGKDTLQFPENVGGSNVSWVVETVIDVDTGVWRLLVGK